MRERFAAAEKRSGGAAGGSPKGGSGEAGGSSANQGDGGSGSAGQGPSKKPRNNHANPRLKPNPKGLGPTDASGSTLRQAFAASGEDAIVEGDQVTVAKT